jgi:hypothetical protein
MPDQPGVSAGRTCGRELECIPPGIGTGVHGHVDAIPHKSFFKRSFGPQQPGWVAGVDHLANAVRADLASASGSSASPWWRPIRTVSSGQVPKVDLGQPLLVGFGAVNSGAGPGEGGGKGVAGGREHVTLYLAMVSLEIWSWIRSDADMASGSAAHRRVEPTTSEDRKVTVPVGTGGCPPGTPST